MSTINSNSLNESLSTATGRSQIEASYATTEAQLEVWLSSQQSIEANCAYNEISSLVFHGPLNANLLDHAIHKLVQRNASLRTTFGADGQVARVLEAANYRLETLDWSENSTIDLELEQREVVQRQAGTPFDLENGPLFRCVLQKISDQQHKLTFTAHHIVMDGWSLAVLVRDLGHFYDSLAGHACESLPHVDTYAEYSTRMAEYIKSDQGMADENFWISQFADQIPVLDLPIAKKRPALRTYSGKRHDHLLSADLIERVRKIGAKAGCSLFNVMLAAFNAYVSRISGCGDFCIGIPTAGQAAMDSPNLIGHCVNTMPLRTRVDSTLSFSEYMKRSRTEMLDAFDHQQYSYGTLLRKLAPPRDPSRPPMLSVSFNVDPMIDTSEIGFQGLTVDLLIEPRSFENFEWFINGVIQADKSVEMQVQYNSDLHSPQSMQFYFEGFEAFLAAIANDHETKISNLPCMSIRQRQKVIVDWNDTTLEYPASATLDREISRQALATPDQVAVVFQDQTLTYSQLEKRSNQIARYLNAQGIATGDLVGICVERSEKMLVNLLAIMKAGAGYVPLDPRYPSDRLQYMCDHSELKLIVTESELLERVSEFGKPMIALDTAAVEVRSLDDSSVTNTARPEDICYVIYTSGSTGKPKGVQVPHGAVVNFLSSMQQTPGFGADDSVLAVTTLSFDIAVLELYLPVVSGGRVVILDSETAADGHKLATQLVKHDISLMQATPATWRLMLGAGWFGKADLKILCGGEPMPQDLVGPLLQRCSELWNMYGPTETTVWSAAYQITDARSPIMIGKPIGNTQIYILDANLNEVPVGCQGEVYIGGAGVTLGYRNRQDLTDERFIENRYRSPFNNYVNESVYKTGDLARYTFDGNIQFLRRNDKQVKVRGFRIELGEIENNLKLHPAVDHNVVVVREDVPGDARLVAYLIQKPGRETTAAEYKQHLRDSLPYYMIPQHFVTLSEFPHTNNGKIDYKALPSPGVEAAETTEIDEPKTPAEKFLASVWSEVLEVDGIGLADNFFDIGGHSLLVMKVISTVKERTGHQLGPQDFLIGTLEQLANMFADSPAFAKPVTQPTVELPLASPTSELEPKPVQDRSTIVNPRQTESESQPRKPYLKRIVGFWG